MHNKGITRRNKSYPIRDSDKTVNHKTKGKIEKRVPNKMKMGRRKRETKENIFISFRLHEEQSWKVGK
jgi:hypothetical protein